MSSLAVDSPSALETGADDATAAAFDAAAVARSVRHAQRRLGAVDGTTRRRVLEQLGALLASREDEILAANAADLEAADAVDLAAPLRGRLALSPAKLVTLREGIAQLAAMDDPVGRAVRRTELDDGLELEQVTSPLGVLLIIFESRPDAVIQIGSLALRAGDGVILKGGSEALQSNRVLVACLRDALTAEGLDADAVVGVEGRDAVQALLDEDESIDLVIPRGSGQLVRSIQASTRIPVLGHAEGVCHLYLHAEADPAMAARLAVDGKTSYPSACNATETLLVHRDFVPRLGPVLEALRDSEVTLRADDAVRAAWPALDLDAASADDAGTEFGDLTLTVLTVDDLDAAIDHVHRHGSAHTDAICTADEAVAESFLRRVDSASVFWNASTRFADGYRYGLGAEVGVATGRIHARGPVGVDGLLTTRWLLRGHGQRTTDYGPGRRAYTHRPLDT
ncbi:MAG: glutamate-5-semialdehyde dehydrogenase [Acidobacteriota bacterium]